MEARKKWFCATSTNEASDENVIAREEASGKFSREDIINRLEQQHYETEWKEDADFVIANDSSKEDFIGRCEALIELIKIVGVQDIPEKSLRSLEE